MVLRKRIVVLCGVLGLAMSVGLLGCGDDDPYLLVTPPPLSTGGTGAGLAQGWVQIPNDNNTGANGGGVDNTATMAPDPGNTSSQPGSGSSNELLCSAIPTTDECTGCLKVACCDTLIECMGDTKGCGCYLQCMLTDSKNVIGCATKNGCKFPSLPLIGKLTTCSSTCSREGKCDASLIPGLGGGGLPGLGGGGLPGLGGLGIPGLGLSSEPVDEARSSQNPALVPQVDF